MKTVFLILKKWWKKDDSLKIIGFLILGLLLAFTIRENFENAKTLRLYGVITRAKIISKQYVKGSHIFQIYFIRKGILYQNECNSNKNFEVGDSIKVEINSKDPSEFCQIVQ